MAERCAYIGPMAAMNVKHALNEIQEAEAASDRHPALDALVMRANAMALLGTATNQGDEDAWREDVEAVYADWSTLDD